MGVLDVIGKVVLQEAPEDVIRLVCPGMAVSSARSLEKEVSRTQRNADKLFLIERGAEEEPLYLHVELMAGWEFDLPKRMHEYWTLFHGKHGALDSVVVILQDLEKKGAPVARYEYTTPLGRTLKFEYGLVCLWELGAEELLKLGSPGILPLLPFSAGASVDRIFEAFEQIEKVADDGRKRELRAGMFGAARMKYDDIDWLKHLGGRAALMGSKVYDEILEEGIEKGIEKERRFLLEQQLLQRLGDRVRPLLKDLSCLNNEALLKIALQIIAIPDDDAFFAELERALGA